MNCDSIARWYRWLEYGAFGGELQRRRVAFLGEMAPAQTALVLGDGDGRFLAELLRANPSVQVDAVDASAAMIALARERTGSGRVRFHCADARELPFAPGAYDLLVTHFFLDCFSDAELAGLIPRLAAASTAEARWVVSEFTLAGGSRARAWIAVLYRLFGWTTGLRVRRLPDFAGALRAAGFALEREEFGAGRLLTSQLWRRM